GGGNPAGRGLRLPSTSTGRTASGGGRSRGSSLCAPIGLHRVGEGQGAVVPVLEDVLNQRVRVLDVAQIDHGRGGVRVAEKALDRQAWVDRDVLRQTGGPDVPRTALCLSRQRDVRQRLQQHHGEGVA